jgi:hypothetical protein
LSQASYSGTILGQSWDDSGTILGQSEQKLGQSGFYTAHSQKHRQKTVTQDIACDIKVIAIKCQKCKDVKMPKTPNKPDQIKIEKDRENLEKNKENREEKTMERTRKRGKSKANSPKRA